MAPAGSVRGCPGTMLAVEDAEVLQGHRGSRARPGLVPAAGGLGAGHSPSPHCFAACPALQKERVRLAEAAPRVNPGSSRLETAGVSHLIRYHAAFLLYKETSFNFRRVYTSN